MSFMDHLNRAEAEQAAREKAEREAARQRAIEERRYEDIVNDFVYRGIARNYASYYLNIGYRVYRINEFPAEVARVFNEIHPHLLYPYQCITASDDGETYALPTEGISGASRVCRVYCGDLWFDEIYSHALDLVFSYNGWVGVRRIKHQGSDYDDDCWACDMDTFKTYWSHVDLNRFYDTVSQTIVAIKSQWR